MPKVHELKINRKIYPNIVHGDKNFEIIKDNADIKVFDFIRFVCVNDYGYDSGKSVVKRISYIYRNDNKELENGYMIIGFNALNHFDQEQLSEVTNA